MHCSGTSRPLIRIVHLLFLSGFATLGACSAPGAVLRAEVLAAPARASLRALAPLDARVCWVSGSGSTVLRTEDGGRTWRAVGPRGADVLDLRSLVAFDGRRAVVASAGQPARILRTGDGGATWQTVHEEPDPAAFFDSMARDGDRIVLYGDPVGGALYVLASEDGGANWRRESVGVAAREGEAGFAASNGLVQFGPGGTTWIATGGAPGSRLLARDASGSWAATDLPLARGEASRGAFAIATDGRGTMVAVGGDHANPSAADGTAAWSDDGGRTWQPANAHGYRSSVAWLESASCWLAAGPQGCCSSTDGGRTWLPCELPGFHVVAVAPDGSVWAAGSDGRIARIRAMQ